MNVVPDGGNSWEFRDCSTDFLKTSSAKTVSSETLVRKLRWATVGIQFDWSKVFPTVPIAIIRFKLVENRILFISVLRQMRR